MLDIQRKQIDKLVALLDAWGCKYKIVLDDGTELGTLEVMPERKKAAPKYPRGSLTDYFLPYISGLRVGDVVSVPGDNYPLDVLRGSLSAWANHHWGTGAVTTYINRKSNTVEVLRIA